MSLIYLAEIVGADAAGTLTTFRYGTAGFATQPGDTPANTYFDGRIIQPGLLTRNLFASRRTTGRSQIGYGLMTLANPDGALDGLIDYGFDGQSLRIYLGDSTWAFSQFSLVLAGTMEQVTVDVNTVTIRLRDNLKALAKALQPNKYGGTNSLPSGTDGTATDIKGQPKPLLWGKVYNVAPVCVNTSELIYQVNDGGISTATVYVKGVALTAGADYSTVGDMEANPPTAGQVRVYPGGGMFRLGTAPAGQVTADVVQTSSAANHTAAQILNAIAVSAGITSINAADIAALDATQPAELGVYVSAEAQPLDIMDQVAASVGAWYAFDSSGTLRMGRLELPTGTAVSTLTESNIIDIKRLPSDDTERGIPAWRVNLGYSRRYVVQTATDMPAATQARIAEAGRAYRTTVADNSAIKLQYPLAPELNRDTLLVDSTAAGAEAARLLTIYSARRDFYEITARTSDTIDLNSVTSVTYSRFGMGSGRLFRVLGITPDLAAQRVRLTVWG